MEIKILFCLILFFAYGCKNNIDEGKVIKVTVYNNSEMRIDSV